MLEPRVLFRGEARKRRQILKGQKLKTYLLLLTDSDLLHIC